MGNKIISRICLDAIFLDLFIVLGFLRIRVGNFLEIGFATIVIAYAAIMFSPVDALIIAFLGEGVNQVFLSPYGLSPTTPLWIMPVVLRALIICLVAYFYKKRGDNLVNHKVMLFVTLMGAALIISGVDTGLLYLDGLIMGYPVSYTLFQTGIRFLSSQINAIICAILMIPLYRATNNYFQRKYNKVKE